MAEEAGFDAMGEELVRKTRKLWINPPLQEAKALTK
jgi:hypothetical protein